METYQIGERSHYIYGPRYYGHLSSDPDNIARPRSASQRTAHAAVESYIKSQRSEPKFRKGGCTQHAYHQWWWGSFRASAAEGYPSFTFPQLQRSALIRGAEPHHASESASVQNMKGHGRLRRESNNSGFYHTMPQQHRHDFSNLKPPHVRAMNA